MISFKKFDFNQFKTKFQVKKPWDWIIISILNILLAFPTFIIVHQNLIDPDWPLNIDRILIVVVVLVSIHFLLNAVKTFLIIAIIVYFFILIYGSLFGNYGFKSLLEDYNSMLYTMSNNPYPQDIIIAKLLPFPNKSKIISAIEYNNPKVRNFAIMATNKHFKHVYGYKNYKSLIQCFAVFKEINSKWNYVNDPKNGDYIARASESLLYFSGDCDDHSILMAAAVRAIGGTPRLIHTKGHIYPEILIGKESDLEIINFLIKNELFSRESQNKQLHYHIDERDNVWLNLDYTAKYPGGPFMSEEILGALTLN